MTSADSTRRVLITGAGGDVATAVSPGLAEHYALTLTDADPEVLAEGVERLDVRDIDAVAEACEDIDTVVHLAGAASPESDWESVLDLNIVGTRGVLEGAQRAGVRRVVLASSNHVTGGYDRDGEWPIDARQPVRPDSLYGVSKAFGETLGRFYADFHDLSVIALRIGWVTGDIGAAGDEEIMSALWLSERDATEVIRCAVEAPVHFGIYYAVSDNPNRRWDLTSTMLDLGYRPQDSWYAAAGVPEDVQPGGHPVRKDWPRD
ncbi:NAD-dependent epimerase/dehydratase family protein [Actinomycetota bacterium]